jgi:hypothetical protein
MEQTETLDVVRRLFDEFCIHVNNNTFSIEALISCAYVIRGTLIYITNTANDEGLERIAWYHAEIDNFLSTHE